MKKFLIYLVGIIVFVGLAGFAFIEIRGVPSYEVKKVDYKVEATPARLERGKKLVQLLCANCHKNSATGNLKVSR